MADRLTGSVGKTTKVRWTDFCSGLRQSAEKKEEANAAKMHETAIGRGEKEGMPLLNPLLLCQTLEDSLPDDSVLVADGGDFVATAANIVRPRGHLRWLDPGAFGTLGVGGGFALGAALVRPTAEVWLLWGDGSAGYSLMEFDTFARHRVPVVALVGNDACWTQIEREQTPMFQDSVSSPPSPPLC
jgi:acetolactate synthase-like protein